MVPTEIEPKSNGSANLKHGAGLTIVSHPSEERECWYQHDHSGKEEKALES
jgi:hypothetical protein